MKKTNFIKIVTIVIFLFFSQNSNSQSNCLVANYKLDGNASNISGNGKSGTLIGTNSVTDRFGKSNSALHFNGTSDYVKLGTDADFKERTISVWLKVDTFLTGGKYSIVFTSDNANLQYGGTGITIDNSGGTNRISFGVGTNFIRYTGATKNTWYHCAITVNATHFKVFVNGKVVDSTLNNSLSHSTDGDTYAHLGSSRNNSLFFKGSIDDVKIYNCALSRTGIDSLYNYKPNNTCIVVDYKLDGNAVDNSENSINGILYGTTPVADRFGKSNNALHFNGTSDYVKLGTDADFKERTISVWLKVDTFLTEGKYSIVFTSDNANLQYGGTGITIDNSGGTNRISFGVGTNFIRYTGATKNTWYHCAIVVTATHFKVYVNGLIIDSTLNNSLSHSTNGSPFANLGASRNSTLFFKGSIDEVKIYDCALSKAELLKLYSFANINKYANHILPIKVYPNPAKDNVTVENTEATRSQSLSFYNIHGQLLLEVTNLQNFKTEIDISQFVKGLYFITIDTNGSKMIARFVKE